MAQLPLFAPATTPVAAPEGESITVTYQRDKAPKLRPDDSGLCFTADVPVKVIQLTPPALQGEAADQYEVIGTHITHRVAQRPATSLPNFLWRVTYLCGDKLLMVLLTRSLP